MSSLHSTTLIELNEVRSDTRVDPLEESLQTVSLDLVTHTSTNKSNKSQPERNPVVPRSEKRGLFASIVFIPEYYDARDYPAKIKWFITFIIAFASITGPMGTLIMLPALNDIVKKLHTSESTVNVSVGIYLIALGVFPLWWSLASERFGRRLVYFVSFIMFFGFSIGTSLAPTIGSLIGLRVLQGGCSALVQAVGAGTISDLFAPHERGRAMGYYYLGPLCGPFLAPILGGAVAQGWGWRATQWLLVIFSGCNCILICFFLPETLRRVDTLAGIKSMLAAGGDVGKETIGAVAEEKEDLEKQHLGMEPSVSQTEQQEIDRVVNRVVLRMSQLGDLGDTESVVDHAAPNLARLTTNQLEYSRRIQGVSIEADLKKAASRRLIAGSESMEKPKEPLKTQLYDFFIRPLHSVVLLTHPPVTLVVIYSAVSFSVLYFFNMTVSYEYSRPPYNFLLVIVGLMYIPNSVTYIVALLVCGPWVDRMLRNYAKKHNGELVPELRILWNGVIAVVMFIPACLIFGWCLQYHEHWVTPLIGTALFGFATMTVIGATVTYLADSLPGKAATGVALNNLVRQILAAVATFVVEPAIKGIGPGKLFSILMAVLTAASVFLVILKWKGLYFRETLKLPELYQKL